MKRISLFALTGFLLVSATAASAQYPFQGPSSQPTDGNVPGVIWNVNGTSVTQPSAKINIGGSAYVGNINTTANSSTILKDIYLDPGYAFHIDNVGASTFNMGNWGSGQQPFTFGVYGDIKMYSFGGLSGQKGRMDAVEICFSGANCRTSWPATGGGGTLTGITAGTGATVTGGAPSPTINVTDLYVNTTGDAMTGQLNLNGSLASYQAMVMATNTSATGYGVKAKGGAGGVLAYGTDASNGFGVYGANATQSNYAFLGTPSYSIYGMGPAYFYNTLHARDKIDIGLDATPSIKLDPGLASGVAKVDINGSVNVTGTVSINNNRNLCLGGVCRNTWPAAGGSPGGASTNIQYNSSGAFAGSANLVWDNANYRMTVNKTLNVNIPGTYDSTLVADEGIKAYNSKTAASSYANCAGDFRSAAGPTVWLGCRQMGAYISGNSKSVDLANSLYAISAIGTSSFQRVNTNGYGIYTSGGVIDLGIAPNTASNILIPTTGGIGFDGDRDNTGFLQLWSNGLFYWDLGTGNRMVIRSSGAGTTYYDFNAGNLTITGRGTQPSYTTWATTSDIRLKNVKGSYSKGLNEITRLQPIVYTYKENNPYGYSSTESSIGFSAQDVQKVIPEAVFTDEKGYLQMNSDPILWAQVNAIKELKAENEELKSRLNDLEAKMGALLKQ